MLTTEQLQQYREQLSEAVEIQRLNGHNDYDELFADSATLINETECLIRAVENMREEARVGHLLKTYLQKHPNGLLLTWHCDGMYAAGPLECGFIFEPHPTLTNALRVALGLPPIDKHPPIDEPQTNRTNYAYEYNGRIITGEIGPGEIVDLPEGATQLDISPIPANLIPADRNINCSEDMTADFPHHARAYQQPRPEAPHE